MSQNNLLKVMCIMGTRPEAIKMAMVVHEMRRRASFDILVCSTGQHREMMQQTLSSFQIEIDADLNIMREAQTLYDVTEQALKGIRDVLQKQRPQLMLVQGDTTTAFAGALAAYYERVPIGHIEAGLRTYNKYSPFPEEKNRHLISVLTDYHFAPTEWSRNNLLRENVSPSCVAVTGNTVIDALMYIVEQQQGDGGKAARDKLRCVCGFDLESELEGKRLILVTGHRRENFGDRFRAICEAIRKIAQARDDLLIVYPVHLNPNVQNVVHGMLSDYDNIRLIPPVDYNSIVYLMHRSFLVLTDSGGIQEEAPSLGKPVLVMRDTTERPEGVEAGSIKLVGTDAEVIIRETTHLLDDEGAYKSMSKQRNPYGDGKAAERIVSAIDTWMRR